MAMRFLPPLLTLTLLVLLAEPQQSLSSSVNLANFLSARLHSQFNANTQFRKLKEEYEKVDFSFKKWDIPNLISELAEDIQLKLEKARKCLSNLRTRVQQLYKEEYQTANGNYETLPSNIPYLESGTMKEMSYSLQHHQNVSFLETVFSTPADVSINGTKVETDIIWTKNLLRTFKKNFNKEPELLLWQYFCTENGVLRLYPATPEFPQTTGTVDYDCRFQPWYIDGDGCAKDIIIAFDLSGSMIGWPLTLAQKTASQTLKLMSDNDFLGFIGISGQPRYLTDNQNNSIKLLSRATDKVKYEVNSRIQAVEPDDEASFDKAIEAAFDMFNDSSVANQSANCQKILIIFSDGTIQNCKDTFERRNPNKDVQVFTFGCGKPRTTTSGLKEMACDNRGNFLKLDELTDVNARTFEFFNLINKNSNSGRGNFTPKWSNAYMEETWAAHIMGRSSTTFERKPIVHGKQMILSVSAPSYYQEKKTGIVGLDMKISNLVGKVANLTKVGLYAIIVNNRGNVIYHPRLQPLANLERTYIARFAELEVCKGNVSSTDIEKAIVGSQEAGGGGAGMMEGDCLYHYSLSLQRGRELYTKMQYHYTSIKGFPFFLVLAIPTAFSYEIESSKNLTDVTPILMRILSSDLRRSAALPDVTLSITGWFDKVENTTKETVRYNTFVVNETAAHYSVVSDIVMKAWPKPDETIIRPVMLYTTAGLLLYNYAGWLDVQENSQSFIENDRLVASLGAASRLTISPQRKSSVYRERDAFLITKNIILQQDFTAITPAVVGTELYKDALLGMFDIGKEADTDRIQSLLVDDKGFIISIEPVNDDEIIIGRHLSSVYPELMTQMLNRSIYTRDNFRNCLHTRKNKTKVPSSARSLSNTMLLLYNTLTLVTTHSQLGSTISLKRGDSYFRCCKDYYIYKLNHESVGTVHQVACDKCDKTLHSVPIKGTNLLLLNDMNPDCTDCNRNRVVDELRARNVTSVYNVSFGELSYSALPCTNNVNISTVCNSRAGKAGISLFLNCFLFYHYLVI